MPDFETWKNATKGVVYILKMDRMGNEVHESVPYERSVSIQKSERLMNQDRAASEDLDVFLNGTMVPVRLLDGDEDAKDIASNPNLMSESDMAALFKGHWKTFESKVGEIQNERTLMRLLDMASDDATVRQQKIIKDRLAVVAPSAYQERDIEQVGRISQGGSAPAPDSEAGVADNVWRDDDTVTGKAVTPR